MVMSLASGVSNLLAKQTDKDKFQRSKALSEKRAALNGMFAVRLRKLSMA